MSLTAADLDDIRRLARNKHLPWGRHDGWEMVAMELLAEVERLRAGIEALIEFYEDRPEPWEPPGFYGAFEEAASDLEELLNPTEGDQS